MPRSLYLSIYVCPNKGSANKGRFWPNPRVKDTRHLHSVVNWEKGRSLWGCSGPGTSATPSPERSRGRFWDQLENALPGRFKKAPNSIREVAPHFETDVQLQCVCKRDSKQTDSCQRAACPLSFTAETWILGQGSPCTGAESALGKPGTRVWVLQLPGANRPKELIVHAALRLSWR